jgi:hypothetical protein
VLEIALRNGYFCYGSYGCYGVCMLTNDVKLENFSLRDKVMDRLTRNDMSIEEISEVIEKMYIADKEDFDKEYVERQVLIWREVNLGEKNNGGPSVHTRVEDWIKSNKSNNPVTALLRVSLRDCYGDLGLKTPNEKAQCRMAFKRLVEKGKIENVPTQVGCYRILNHSMDEIDFINVDTTPFPIKYPLNVHEYVDTYKKSLVVLAGEPNAGKTAYLLNLAWKNRAERPNYFSSEMGAAELNIRLRKFGKSLDEWKAIRFLAKSSDFKDVIDPNGLNIIDYLEVSKDFYEIGGMLTDIFNNLKDGVAVVAIQKPSGRDTGVGGARTLDKARLYMAIEPGVLKIVKGKLWRQECVNPNGLFCKWTLGGGANFKEMPDPNNGDLWRRNAS